MKSRTEYLMLNIPSKMAFVNITPKVQDVITKSGVREGSTRPEASNSGA